MACLKTLVRNILLVFLQAEFYRILLCLFAFFCSVCVCAFRVAVWKTCIEIVLVMLTPVFAFFVSIITIYVGSGRSNVLYRLPGASSATIVSKRRFSTPVYAIFLSIFTCRVLCCNSLATDAWPTGVLAADIIWLCIFCHDCWWCCVVFLPAVKKNYLGLVLLKLLFLVASGDRRSLRLAETADSCAAASKMRKAQALPPCSAFPLAP